MLFKKGEWDNLGKFYISKLVQVVASVIMPFAIVYFRDINLTFTQISILFAVFGISTFLFEIPTGAIADGHSRKLSVLIGSFSSALFVLGIAFVSSFWWILLFYGLLGISQTFVSGADSSWIVSNLKKKRKEKLQQEYFIKLEVIYSIGVVIAPLIGVFLLKNFSYAILWIVFALGFLFEGLILAFIPEYYSPKKSSLKKAFKNVFKQAKKGLIFVKKKKELIYFFMAGVFVMFMGLGDEAWQPLFTELGGQAYQLGYLYSLTALACVGVPFLVRRFSHWKIKYVLMFSELFSAIVLLSVFLIKPGMFWYILFPFVLFSVVDTFNEPIKQNYLHKQLKENTRATVMSMHSMLYYLSATITTLAGGVLLDMFPLKWVIAGGGIFVIGAVYFYNKLNS